jgi:hypothetical protein
MARGLFYAGHAKPDIRNLRIVAEAGSQLRNESVMSNVREALEAWRAAIRDLEDATPWTADWLRARMVEEDRRLAYQTLAEEVEPSSPIDAVERAYEAVD